MQLGDAVDNHCVRIYISSKAKIPYKLRRGQCERTVYAASIFEIPDIQHTRWVPQWHCRIVPLLKLSVTLSDGDHHISELGEVSGRSSEELIFQRWWSLTDGVGANDSFTDDGAADVPPGNVPGGRMMLSTLPA